jgi:mRNA-degrading endonuclease YafQ of YafQ-DinJ toxin-antitoxin module
MEVSFSESFKKVFKKRIKNAESEQAFWEKVEVFIENPYDSRLKTHKLSGQLEGLSSFSIAYDLRVVFYFTKEKPTKAVFIDIGNHDEVY